MRSILWVHPVITYTPGLTLKIFLRSCSIQPHFPFLPYSHPPLWYGPFSHGHKNIVQFLLSSMPFSVIFFTFPRKLCFSFYQAIFYHHSCLCSKEALPLVLESPLALELKPRSLTLAFHYLATHSFPSSSENGFLLTM